jgi:hypothetical protein
LLAYLHDTSHVQERLLRGEATQPAVVRQAMHETLSQMERQINGNGH